MSNDLLTDEQKEQMFLTNPDVLEMVKRAIKKTKHEIAKQIFKELEKNVFYSEKDDNDKYLGENVDDEKYEKLKAKFLQEQTKHG